MDETETGFTQRNFPAAQRGAEDESEEESNDSNDDSVHESTRTSELELNETIKDGYSFKEVTNKKKEKKDRQRKKA